MKRSWFKHTWLRRTTYSCATLLSLCLFALMKTPTLVIWGKQDTIEDSSSYVQRWHQLNPQASIVVLDQAGHGVYDDQPEKVNQLLLSFLAV